MGLTKVLTRDTIRLGLADIDKRAVIEELVDLLIGCGKGYDKDAIISAVLDREAKGSTGLENGIAVPHARTTGVADVVCALGISRDGMDFDSIDKKPCHLIFLIVAHPQESTRYLKALSAVALIGRDASVVSRLTSANSPEEVVSILAEVSGTNL